MAGSSLIALIDDIAAILDDVALLTKAAAKKTAGVLGDDLALNAHMVGGVNADRELPVVWAVAKGSAVNKAIIVPAALAISALAPWAVKPLLMVGGAYLCYEGAEKIAHEYFHFEAVETPPQAQPVSDLSDVAAVEREKIRGAIRTDFILSAEIVTIALGTVAASSFSKQVMVLTGVAVIMTVGVYGLVAGIVRLDDAGLRLSLATGPSRSARIQRALGYGILSSAPYLMKGLSVAGTAAMFLVGGGIMVHGIPVAGDWSRGLHEAAGGIPFLGGPLEILLPLLTDVLFGLVAGAVILLAVSGFHRQFRRGRH